ncbi:MAG: FMN-dependent NADH-azoreductase, partial [Burkholderia sp.]|nr:FMN-dependent NADH-azoreductase [Burkholderia sp.]
KLILNVIGITDVTIVAGGGAKAVDMGEATMDSFVGTLVSNLEQAAAA